MNLRSKIVPLRSNLNLRGRIGNGLRTVEKVIDLAFPPDELTQLANKYGSDKGSRMSSRHYYTRIYHRFLAHLRRSPITLLEIGLQWRRGSDDCDAPSLRMWGDYFPHARLIGFDIEDFRGVSVCNSRILQGDMSSREDLSRLFALGPFDVVIDDGSHLSAHQQIAVACLFPHIKPGGLYFIEDLNWQHIEPADVPRTRTLLRRKSFVSPVITSAETQFLVTNVQSIRLFDTCGIGPFNQDKRDALALLTKTK